MWTIFKVFIEFVTILFLFYAFWPRGMWDLIESASLHWKVKSHWTTREVPLFLNSESM